MIATNQLAGRITAPRLRVDSVESLYTWQQKRPAAIAGPATLGFVMIDNSTGVSARKRRRL